MMTFDKEEAILGIPPSFKERCALRCLESKFGPNKNDNPMITVQWEVVGYFDNDNNLQTEMRRGDKVYKLAGLKTDPTYFTLTDKAKQFYKNFYDAVHPDSPLETLDESNPDIAYLDGLIMTSQVLGKVDVSRRILTDEEKELCKKEGKPLLGEPILDGDGKKIESIKLSIIPPWLKPYKGELPA